QSTFRACFVERCAEPVARPVADQKCIMTIAGKRQLPRLARFVVTHAAPFDVAPAGLGINEAHAGQDILLSCHLQEATSVAFWHALRRQTTVQVAFAAVTLAVPLKHVGEYAKQPLHLWMIRVWER